MGWVMSEYKLPPNIGDRIVIGDWTQFLTTVAHVEMLEDKRICIHVTIEYPDDPYFPSKYEISKVYLHEEGQTWYRYGSHPSIN